MTEFPNIKRKTFPPDAGAQWQVDYHTWIPVAFFSWFDVQLHQLWVTPYGQTEWRKVETRSMKEWAKNYAECQVYGGGADEYE